MSDEELHICYDRIFEPSSDEEMALLENTLWRTGATLRVRFMDGIAGVQAKVEQVAKQWSEFANIKFDFSTDPDAEIRISFVADRGSWSYLGNVALAIPKDRPTMNYGWLKPETGDDEYSRVVLHEFGHALGCIHEHQHPTAGIPWNKPEVYRRYAGPPNFWSQEKVDFNLFKKYSVDQTQFSAFDTASIMLYPIPKQLTDGVFEVGWNRQLSAKDKSFISTIYSFDPRPVVDLTIGAAPTSGDIGQRAEEDLFRFKVLTQGTYVIETDGTTDVMIGVFGPDNREQLVAGDDDSGRGLNARVSTELVPGDYFVRVHHYSKYGIGKYSISVRIAT